MGHHFSTVLQILPISMDFNASAAKNSSILQLWSASLHHRAVNTTTICTTLFPHSKTKRLTSRPTIFWLRECWLTLLCLTAIPLLLSSMALPVFSALSLLFCLMFQARSAWHVKALNSSITLLTNARKDPLFSFQPISTNLLLLLKFQLTITKKNFWIKLKTTKTTLLINAKMQGIIATSQVALPVAMLTISTFKPNPACFAMELLTQTTTTAFPKVL